MRTTEEEAALPPIDHTQIDRLRKCARRTEWAGERPVPLDAEFKGLDDLQLALGHLFRFLEEEQALSDRRRRQLNEMRNAFPEMLVAFDELYKKWAFAFRQEPTPQPNDKAKGRPSGRPA